MITIDETPCEFYYLDGNTIVMNGGLMVASTTVMGGTVAWATGGDFLQGAMQGMTIGLFNHAMHDNENIMGGSALCAVSSDGTYEVQESLKEVKIIANRLYKYFSTVPIEKPLESVYPEFGVIMLGRAIVAGSVQVAWCIGKHLVGDFIQYVQSETGGISAWIRIHDSHSNSGNFDTRSVVWGSNTHYRKNIGTPTLRKYNEKLRNTRIPINNWRTTDNGHFHIRKR